MAPGDTRIRLTTREDGRVVLTMHFQDGSRLQREVVEVKAQATERRRFEDPDSDEAYAIQAATGALGLFDRDGLIRTATKIP